MTILKAVLGPTNTGKTHYAIERMAAHSSGMIGLPLRLLAREVYDRMVERKGEASCALITGEERIEPETARYFICTVESMPVQKTVEFLAIDEIQLAEDEDRGHIYTDRILNARGTAETLLLGADTMSGVLRELDLDFESDVRERFSELTYGGRMKLTKLPKRTAIVAFSADDVYAIAELLRRQKGGAAVVMGALSPRTRNAQVALYQQGEVDYLVATDAIGMGLNLDVDRVAFAARFKYDGRRRRALTAAEAGQIAGRAGRFRDNGEFGETADCLPFEEEDIKRIEEHNFEPVDTLQWRSSDLHFASIKSLIASLSKPSGHPCLRQNPHALDEWVLRRMAEDEAIGPDVRGEQNIRRLWDLARLPDFRKAGFEGHGRLVLGLAETLKDPGARLGDEAMEKRLDALALTTGDIAQLQQRLAMIRTWTYISFRDDWLANPKKWRSRTREIEDSLSDALHEALTHRFVDRRTTALLAKLKSDEVLEGEMSDSGDVTVDGHVVGKLVGLKFEPASRSQSLEGKAVRGAAEAAVKPILAQKLALIAKADDRALRLAQDGTISFDPTGNPASNPPPIAKLVKGPDWLSPKIELIGGQEAEDSGKASAVQRIEAWLAEDFKKRLPSHYAMKFSDSAKSLEGLARGIAFRVMESGAAVDLRNEDPSHRLTQDQRVSLKTIGVRSGRTAAHVPDAQKPAAQKLIAVFRTVFDEKPTAAAPEGAGSFALDGSWSEEALAANGYLRFGSRAVRADLAERLAWEISKRRKEADKNAFALPAELASIVSCPGDDFPLVLKGLGIVPAEKDKESGAVTLWRYGSRHRPNDGPPRGKGPRKGKPGPKDGQQRRGKGGGGRPHRGASHAAIAAEKRKNDPDNPFAALAALIPEKPKPKPKKKKKKKAKAAAAPTSTYTYTPFS